MLKECQTVTSVDRVPSERMSRSIGLSGDTVAANLPFAVTKYIALLMTHHFSHVIEIQLLCLLASIIRLAEVTRFRNSQ